MKKRFLLYPAMVLLMALCASPGAEAFFLKKQHPGRAMATFHDGMRDLWNDHGVWTREVVVSSLSDLPSTQKALERLMKNQEDIGKAVAGYYGNKAGAALTKLLKEHIALAGAVLVAAKKGDKKEMTKQNELWHKNASDIADFLSKANPHIRKNDMRRMLFDHLALLSDFVKARLNKNWAQDAVQYDAYRGQLNHMADALSNAIIRQFPQKFGLPARAKDVKPARKGFFGRTAAKL